MNLSYIEDIICEKHLEIDWHQIRKFVIIGGKRLIKRRIPTVILLCLGGAIIIATITSLSKDTKSYIIDYVQSNSDELDQFVTDIIETQTSSAVFDKWQATYYPSVGMVEFIISKRGFGSQTIYEGFYYAQQDSPIGFQGTELDFWGEGSGWKWQDSNSDNQELIEKITSNWYWFKMEF